MQSVALRVTIEKVAIDSTAASLFFPDMVDIASSSGAMSAIQSSYKKSRVMARNNG
jgi:hypothetical protein